MTDQTEPGLVAALRTEVALLRGEEQRRVFALRLALGEPGVRGPRTLLSGGVAPWEGAPWPTQPWLDRGLRLDVADRLVGRVATTHAAGDPVRAWLLRPGQPSLHDEDVAWLAATRHALSAHGLDLDGFWSVTRYGWLDPVSGASRSWKRLRIR